jgi:hypothetical protein
MRGDQLARPWGIIRAIKASPNGLAVTSIEQRQETIRTIYRDLEPPQVPGDSPHAQRVQRANCWAFINTSKFKIPPPFTLI